MPQYSTNAIYEYLKTKDNLQHNYIYIHDGNWLLIYGDENAMPKLFLIVTRMPAELDEQLTLFEQNALRLLANQPTPIRMLRFNEHKFSKETAVSNKENKGFQAISTADLYAVLFEPYGLKANANIAAKQVNEATSSTFHDWQRSFLSGKLTLTDVDVIAYNNNYEILGIFELKRSFAELDKWKPYAADYANFRLLKRAFDPAISILILYNLYKGNPRVEYISLLRVFKIANDTPTISNVYLELDTGRTYNFPIDQVFN